MLSISEMFIFVNVFSFWGFFPGENVQNTYRRMVHSLEEQVQDLKDEIALLKTLVH